MIARIRKSLRCLLSLAAIALLAGYAPDTKPRIAAAAENPSELPSSQ
jgi:hypothetical protein